MAEQRADSKVPEVPGGQEAGLALGVAGAAAAVPVASGSQARARSSPPVDNTGTLVASVGGGGLSEANSWTAEGDNGNFPVQAGEVKEAKDQETKDEERKLLKAFFKRQEKEKGPMKSRDCLLPHPKYRPKYLRHACG